jgi:hypothetical protein
MTDLSMWSQLSPEERAEAVTKAREIMAGGVTRWAVIARLCGLSQAYGLRYEIDHEWREQQMAECRERASRRRAKAAPASAFDKTQRQRRAAAERGRKSARIASMLASAGKRGAFKGMLNTRSSAPVTLPRVSILEG